jgi:Flp pilus assembly protein TadB
MTGNTLLATLAGGGAGLGLLLILISYGDAPTRRGLRWSLSRTQRRRLLLALAAALLTLIVTRWVAAALGIGVLVGCWDRVFGGTRRARAATAQLEALAGWTESLRDLLAAGVALPEALPASVTSAAPAVRPALGRLAERLQAREPIDAALWALGDELNDGGADLVVAALLLNSRAQGRSLAAVLTALSVSLRSELRVRRTVEAERRSSRRAVQIVVAVTLVTALGLCLGNPVYVAPYGTPAGQVMLGVVAVVFGAGFAWLARLSRMPATPRLLEVEGASR